MSLTKVLLLAWLVACTSFPVSADDPTASAFAAFRLKRGQAIARENEAFQRVLEQMLAQERSRKNTAEIERLEVLLEQLKKETATMKSKGDEGALFPKTPKELRAFLIGTSWSFDGSRKTALEFKADGSFAGKNDTFQYVIVSGRRVSIIWSPSSRVDCELSDDGSELVEKSGAQATLKRVR
jgi:hypothetical protein